MSKKILEIPKIKQLPYCCGPASLCMVSHYLGKKISQEKMVSYFGTQEFIKLEKGVTLCEIQEVAKQIGFNAERYEYLDLNDIGYFIEENFPLIVKCRMHNYPRTRHFYVVKGYDINKQEIFVNDPWDLRKNKFDYDVFKKIGRIQGEYSSIRYGLVIGK